MPTFEQKYEEMKNKLIEEFGEDLFNSIKEKIFYSKECDSFHLVKRGNEHEYQFYNAMHKSLTSGFKSIVSAYINK